MNKVYLGLLVFILSLGFGSSVFAESRSSRVNKRVKDMQQQAQDEKWTFQVGYHPVMEYPVEDVTGLIVPENWNTQAMYLRAWPTTATLPSKFDWRDQTPGGLQPIKNQRNCGSCWAFATTAVLESLIKIRDNTVKDLSEQQLVSCSTFGDCGGGYFAHDFHVKTGATTTADFPYSARNVRCKTGLKPNAKLESWAYVGGSGRSPSVEQIKQAIIENGPVAVTVTATSSMSAYKSGVFNNCSRGRTNHMVNLVGWNDDEGAWIMRNSWGATWGEKGYMRIKYACSRIGEIASFAVYKPMCAPQPNAFTGDDVTIQAGDSVKLGDMPITGQSYQWTPADTLDEANTSSPLATPTKTTTYTLKVTNKCGTAEKQVKVTVQ